MYIWLNSIVQGGGRPLNPPPLAYAYAPTALSVIKKHVRHNEIQKNMG